MITGNCFYGMKSDEAPLMISTTLIHKTDKLSCKLLNKLWRQSGENFYSKKENFYRASLPQLESNLHFTLCLLKIELKSKQAKQSSSGRRDDGGSRAEIGILVALGHEIFIKQLTASASLSKSINLKTINLNQTKICFAYRVLSMLLSCDVVISRAQPTPMTFHNKTLLWFHVGRGPHLLAHTFYLHTQISHFTPRELEFFFPFRLAADLSLLVFGHKLQPNSRGMRATLIELSRGHKVPSNSINLRRVYFYIAFPPPPRKNIN